MAFQQFRLGELSLHHSIPPHIPDTGPSHTTFATNPHKSVSSSKQPYGSGDTDDGYTLVFPNIDAFQAWRLQEEEQNMVEFVKGDTHGSKAIPPRFRDHTKLVCARHSRSGRKKYVKKHPDRVRKVPSRKLEGQGCPASISYKTYFETEEVRACYISQHSHEIGPANLPYTRRGRKATVQTEKEKRSIKATSATPSGVNSSSAGPSSSSIPVPDSSASQSMAGTSPMPQNQQVQQIQQQQQQQVSSASANQMSSFSSAVSMLAPLPNQQTYAAAPQAYNQSYNLQNYGVMPPQGPISNERWDNMNILFNTIRDHARTFEYPSASVAALETVLIRLYLESPMGVGAPAPNLGGMMAHQLLGGGRVTTVQSQQGQGMTVNGQNEGTAQNDGNS